MIKILDLVHKRFYRRYVSDYPLLMRIHYSSCVLLFVVRYLTYALPYFHVWKMIARCTVYTYTCWQAHAYACYTDLLKLMTSQVPCKLRPCLIPRLQSEQSWHAMTCLIPRLQSEQSWHAMTCLIPRLQSEQSWHAMTCLIPRLQSEQSWQAMTCLIPRPQSERSNAESNSPAVLRRALSFLTLCLKFCPLLGETVQLNLLRQNSPDIPVHCRQLLGQVLYLFGDISNQVLLLSLQYLLARLLTQLESTFGFHVLHAPL